MPPRLITEDLRSALGTRGYFQYGVPGCVASSPAAVRLAEFVGGGLLKRTYAGAYGYQRREGKIATFPF